MELLSVALGDCRCNERRDNGEHGNNPRQCRLMHASPCVDYPKPSGIPRLTQSCRNSSMHLEAQLVTRTDHVASSNGPREAAQWRVRSRPVPFGSAKD
jgi:hypothetical protein